MANYYGKTRTNYFHVTDEKKFFEIMSKMHLDEDELQVWGKDDGNGGTLHGFGGYGTLCFYDDDNYAMDDFIDDLSEILPENEACIILEIGNEKLRYFEGIASIITRSGFESIDLNDWAVSTAQVMLGDSNYRTSIAY